MRHAHFWNKLVNNLGIYLTSSFSFLPKGRVPARPKMPFRRRMKMPEVRCEAVTCKFYENGTCKAEVIELRDVEYKPWDEDEYTDGLVCQTYVFDPAYWNRE